MCGCNRVFAHQLIPRQTNSRAAAIDMQNMLTSFREECQETCRHQLVLAGWLFSAGYVVWNQKWQCLLSIGTVALQPPT